MIHQEFIEAVEDSPVIAAVKDMEGFAAALTRKVKLFLFCSAMYAILQILWRK